MTDIVKMLRECSSDEAYLSRQAADEITRLTAENEKLDEAMEMLLTDVRRTDLDMSGLKAENERLSAYAKRAAMDVLLCKDGNILLHEKNEKLRAALEPLACTCDRPNGAACSRSEVDCPFWNARAALEEKQMTDITIPPEALEAAAKIIRDSFYNITLRSIITNDSNAENVASAACQAMLKAWPGMTWACRGKGTPPHLLFLPLPTDNSND